MNNRRDFLKTTAVGAMALSPLGKLHAVLPKKSIPTRFIFLHKANGTFPSVMVPPSLNDKHQAMEKKKEAFEVDLDKHELPDWMETLDKHKENLTILQGLSGKMCTTGHHTWCSSLGVYKATERLSSIRWATVDFELAKLFPSPFEHIELACFPSGGGNGRGNINGIEKGFSARGPQLPNYAYGSPAVAMKELFKSVSNSKADTANYAIDRKVLEFMALEEHALSKNLKNFEKVKVANYAASLDTIRSRNKKIDQMADQIRKYEPKLDQKYFADDLKTFDRQDAFTEILLACIMSGMTNVMAYTLDELGTTYTGINGIENEIVNQHDVGHGKKIAGLEPVEIRERIRRHHMKQIDRIVSRLKAEPEGNGSMFDNTVLFYFPESGETHHSWGTEYPFMVLAGENAKLNIGRRYIRLPYWGNEGCKTLGNFYTTLLNAYGNPVKHYGAMDLSLRVDQTGPIKQLMV